MRLVVGGLGASTQHPIASALVARAFAGPRSLKALGTYNFSGDLGKMTVPAILSLMLLVMAWRPALAILGGVGFVVAAAIFVLTPRYGHEAAVAADAKAGNAGAVRPMRLAFPLLIAIGIIDSATRMGFLLFLPFVLTSKGASLQTIGFAMTLVFAGGAAGKLVCAFIGARIGAVGTVWLTEGLTAAGILALLPLPLAPALLLLPVHRRRAQWHFVGALWLGAGPRRARASHARLQHFLHRHDRLRRRCAGALWLRRRCHRRDRGVALCGGDCAADAAAFGRVAAGIAPPAQCRGGVSGRARRYSPALLVAPLPMPALLTDSDTAFGKTSRYGPMKKASPVPSPK